MTKQLSNELNAIRIESIINCLLNDETCNTDRLIEVLSVSTKLEVFGIIKMKLPEHYEKFQTVHSAILNSLH